MRIIQIMPAEGWIAMYGKEGKVHRVVPLACWALVEFTEGTKAAPGEYLQEVIGMEEHESKILLCPTAKNFVGYKRKAT